MIPHNHNRKVRRPRMVAVRNKQPHCVFYTIEWLSDGKWRKILNYQRKRHRDEETKKDNTESLVVGRKETLADI